MLILQVRSFCYLYLSWWLQWTPCRLLLHRSAVEGFFFAFYHGLHDWPKASLKKYHNNFPFYASVDINTGNELNEWVFYDLLDSFFGCSHRPTIAYHYLLHPSLRNHGLLFSSNFSQRICFSFFEVFKNPIFWVKFVNSWSLKILVEINPLIPPSSWDVNFHLKICSETPKHEALVLFLQAFLNWSSWVWGFVGSSYKLYNNYEFNLGNSPLNNNCWLFLVFLPTGFKFLKIHVEIADFIVIIFNNNKMPIYTMKNGWKYSKFII